MRITMKDISEQLADTNVVRCHRSYMVNLDLVKVIRREKENLFLELFQQRQLGKFLVRALLIVQIDENIQSRYICAILHLTAFIYGIV